VLGEFVVILAERVVGQERGPAGAACLRRAVDSIARREVGVVGHENRERGLVTLESLAVADRIVVWRGDRSGPNADAFVAELVRAGIVVVRTFVDGLAAHFVTQAVDTELARATLRILSAALSTFSVGAEPPIGTIVAHTARLPTGLVSQIEGAVIRRVGLICGVDWARTSEITAGTGVAPDSVRHSHSIRTRGVRAPGEKEGERQSDEEAQGSRHRSAGEGARE
jgi:hypothetical protein